jgi:hypothetical protein
MSSGRTRDTLERGDRNPEKMRYVSRVMIAAGSGRYETCFPVRLRAPKIHMHAECLPAPMTAPNRYRRRPRAVSIAVP